MKHNINFVDALPLMQRKIDTLELYPPTYNHHPGNKGYYLIAKSVFNKMQATNIVAK
jgi:hypothetical protein